MDYVKKFKQLYTYSYYVRIDWDEIKKGGTELYVIVMHVLGFVINA